MNTNQIAPRTILLTGLSASGKTTLGRRLHAALQQQGVSHVRLLDGEDVRAHFRAQGRQFGYSPEERNALAMEIARMAKRANDEGHIAVVCAIVHLRQTREEMRREIGNLMEVYLECSPEICAQRDYKGQYEKALAGQLANFVGVTEPYETSPNPDLILATGRMEPDQCLEVLLDRTLRFLQVPRVEA